MNYVYGQDGAHNPSNKRHNANIHQSRYIDALTEAFGPINVTAPVSDCPSGTIDLYDVNDCEWIKVFRRMDYGAIEMCVSHPYRPCVIIDVGAFVRVDGRCPKCEAEMKEFRGEYGAFLNGIDEHVLLYFEGGLWHPSICFGYDEPQRVWERIVPYLLRQAEG